MPRVLLLIILVWALIVVLKRVASSSKPSDTNQHRSEEKIVQCATCGLRVPESESREINGRILCNNPQCQSHS